MTQREIENILFNLLNNDHTKALLKAGEPILSMLDAAPYEYVHRRHGKLLDCLYKDNEASFDRIGNQFFLANNLKRSENPEFALRAVCWGNCHHTRAVHKPFNAAFMFLNISAAKVEELKKVLLETKKDVFKFRLNNGAGAYLGLTNYYGEERVHLVIPNRPAEMKIPFSKYGNQFKTYQEACREEGTLPWMVETNFIAELFPIRADKKAQLGFKPKASPRETLELKENSDELLKQVATLKTQLGLSSSATIAELEAAIKKE